MKKLIPMGSIPQFREVVRNIKHMTRYVGKDKDGNPIYNNDELPVLTVIGTEKLHGTQMGVSYNIPKMFWVQSKNNIITPQKDNNGCAFAAYNNKIEWIDIILELSKEYIIDLHRNTITIFAEWCGGNIQKNSAASGLDKRAVIFKYFKVTPFDCGDDNPAYWLETKTKNGNVKNEEHNIFNIVDFPSTKVTIDFNHHEEAQNKIMEIIQENELHSPFGKTFGKEDNILEGYVFGTMYKGVLLRWKSKGDKHSKSKVKVQKTYTPEELEKLNKADKCAEEIFSHQRCNQALVEIFGLNDEDIDIKQLGKYLKWVATDTIKEESDIIAEYGLEPRDVMKKVQNMAKQYFFGIINS